MVVAGAGTAETDVVMAKRWKYHRFFINGGHLWVCVWGGPHGACRLVEERKKKIIICSATEYIPTYTHIQVTRRR